MIYDYVCPQCGPKECNVRFIDRDNQTCSCGLLMKRQMSAPAVKIAGRVVSGGGPDRFTADMLGIPLKDLPAGLKTSG